MPFARADVLLCELRHLGRKAELVLRVDMEENENAYAVADAFAEWFSLYICRAPLDLPPGGTDLQRRIWAATQQIPFGETRTYTELGNQFSEAPQTVYAAFQRLDSDLNVPWHRVVRDDRRIGEARQALLLFLEGHDVYRHDDRWRLRKPGHRR